MNTNAIPILDFLTPVSAVQINDQLEELFAASESANGPKLIDASKCFLETIFKTIITDRNGQIAPGKRNPYPDFLELYKQARDCVEVSKDPEVAEKIDQICIESIRSTSKLRNAYGISSHGRDAYNTDEIDPVESLFIARISLAITNLFYVKHLKSPSLHLNARLQYEDYEDFNQYFDSIVGDVGIAGITLVASEVMFKTDPEAYKEFLLEYKSNSYIEDFLEREAP